MAWNPLKRFFTIIRLIDKCYMKIDRHVYLIHTNNAYKLTQYINTHPTQLLKIIHHISTKTIHDLKNNQKSICLVSFQLVHIILQSFNQQLDLYIYELCLMIKSGWDAFHSSINEISLETFVIICKYIHPVSSSQIYHFNELVKHCSKMASGKTGDGTLRTIKIGLKALTHLISTNWFSTLDSIYYRQHSIHAALWNIYSSDISDLDFNIDLTSNSTLPSMLLLDNNNGHYHQHHHQESVFFINNNYHRHSFEDEPELLSLFIICKCCQSENEALISVSIRSTIKFIDQQKSWWPAEKNILLFKNITYAINEEYRYLMVDYLLNQLEISILQLSDIQQSAGLVSIITSLLSDKKLVLGKKPFIRKNNDYNTPSIHLSTTFYDNENKEKIEQDNILKKHYNTLITIMKKFILSNYYIQLDDENKKYKKQKMIGIHSLSQLNIIIQRRIIICIGSITNRYEYEISFMEALSAMTDTLNTAIHLEQVARFNSKSLYLFVIQSIISIIKQNQKNKWYEQLCKWLQNNTSCIEHSDLDIRIGYGQSILYFVKMFKSQHHKETCSLLDSLHHIILSSIEQPHYSLVDALFLHGLLLAVITEEWKNRHHGILCSLPFVLKLQSICQYNSKLPRWLRIVLASTIVQWLELVTQSSHFNLLNNYLKGIIMNRKKLSCWYTVSYIDIDSLILPQDEINRVARLNSITGSEEEMINWLGLDYNWILNMFIWNWITLKEEDNYDHFLQVSRNLDHHFNPIQLYFDVEQQTETDEIRRLLQ
ncbi:hypothetical protein BJ944DRAFT_268064 [Cunninghamella echinulata]|nr:hypothetical protein BJ944DRAFT_268064 [Cunninghamella echinulata]